MGCPRYRHRPPECTHPDACTCIGIHYLSQPSRQPRGEHRLDYVNLALYRFCPCGRHTSPKRPC
jgi:hypothetical protein